MRTAQLYAAFRSWGFDATGFGAGRWSINAFVFAPEDLSLRNMNDCHLAVDDEDYLSNILPKVLGRHTAAAGDALMAHFAYYPQREWLESKTAILSRYAALAESLAR